MLVNYKEFLSTMVELEFTIWDEQKESFMSDFEGGDYRKWFFL